MKEFFRRSQKEELKLKTFKDFVLKVLPKYKERKALSIDKEDLRVSYTYKELREKIISLSYRLLDMGFERGDKISILSESRPRWSIAYFAITSIGVTAVPVDIYLKPKEMTYMLNHSETKAIFISSGLLSKFNEIKDELPNIKYVFTLDRIEGNGYMFIDEMIKKGEALRKEDPEDRRFVEAPVEEEDIASLLYTSGTTGVSKGVMLTHKNILSDVDAVYQIFNFAEKDRAVSVLPLHHSYEFTAGLVTLLYCGLSVTYAGSLAPQVLIGTFRKVRPTVVLVVPLLLEKLYKGVWREIKKKGKMIYYIMNSLHGISMFLCKYLNIRIGKFIFRSIVERLGLADLRFFISGGGPLSKPLISGYKNFGITILQGYGLTETSPITNVNLEWKNKIGSVGPAIPGVKVDIANKDKDGRGEIIISGPVVMKGYYKNEEATREVLRDGWLYTGDSGYLDSDGFLYITGRLKSMIVTKGGKNIFPEEIELVLSESPYIAEVLVVGRYDPNKKDEVPYAIIYPNYEELEFLAKEKGFELTDEKIKDILKREIQELSKELADYKRVKDFELRKEEFPKTSTRKIKRYLFQEERHIQKR